MKKRIIMLSTLIIMTNSLLACTNEQKDSKQLSKEFSEEIENQNSQELESEQTELQETELEETDFVEQKTYTLPDGVIGINSYPCFGSISDVILNDDGTYTCYWSSLSICRPMYITVEEYNNLQLGSLLPVDDEEYSTFHCVDTSDGYYFVDKDSNSLDEGYEYVTFWVSDKNMEDGKIRVYSRLGVATDEFAEAEYSDWVSDVSSIISADATIKILNEDYTNAPEISFSDFFNSDYTSWNNFNSNWRGMAVFEVVGDEFGRIISICEQALCG